MDEDVIRLAIQALDAEIAKEPQNARLYMERGRLRMSLGEHVAAMNDLKEAANLNPSLIGGIEGKFTN